MDYEIALRKIFIGGLSYATDDDKLRQYFQQFGAVHDAVVMKDPISRRSRGFGFITYENASSVDKALAQEIHTIDSRQVEAKRAVPRSETRDPPHKSATITSALPIQANFTQSSPPSQTPPAHSSTLRHDPVPSNAKIFVGGLHYDTRDAEFRNYFEKYGKVVASEVMFNRETHKSRGFGFIVYESDRSVDEVCAVKEHYIAGKLVEVKRAVPRSKLVPVSSPSSQLSSSPTVYQPSTPIFSSNNEIENLDNFSLTSEKSSSAPAASYAAALKSGSHTSMPETGAPAVVQSHPHQSVQSAIPFDQSPSQSSSSPYLHGLLSEPVNVTGYHLRSHASSLSEMDLNNSIFSFGSYDHAFHHHQQQFDHYSYTPNSPITPPMPLRHRAVTESYLLEQSPQSQGKQSYLHQSMYQRNQTASFASTMMNSQVPEYRQEYLRQEELTAHCNSRSPSIHSMHADSHSTSPLQQFNQAVNTPIWEGFENHRTNIERSVSLGWAPSSITSPSRRGMSDVGLTDISITLHSNSTINPSIPMQHPAPSEEAWSSLVDLNVGMQLPPRNSNIDPNDLSVRLDYDYSMSFHQDHRYSDASNLHVSGRSSSHMTGSPSRNTSLTMTNENHPIAEGIQELRLQAKEFVPQSQQQSQQQQQWSGSNSTPLPSLSSTSS